MSTIFAEVECLINSRPLGYPSNDPNDPQPLTPNHIILGRATATVPQGPYQETRNLRKRFEFVQMLLNYFWKRFVREYLPKLMRRAKWQLKRRQLQVGDVVLLVDNNAPGENGISQESQMYFLDQMVLLGMCKWRPARVNISDPYRNAVHSSRRMVALKLGPAGFVMNSSNFIAWHMNVTEHLRRLHDFEQCVILEICLIIVLCFSVVLISFAIAVSCIWQLMNSFFSFIWQLVNSLFLGLKFLGFNFSCDQRQYSEDTIYRIDLFSSSKPQRSTLQNLLLVLLINYNKDWKKPLMVWCVCRLLHQEVPSNESQASYKEFFSYQLHFPKPFCKDWQQPLQYI